MSSRDLESMLGALREEMRGREAPERVEQALQNALRARARRRWLMPLAVAAAALLVIGATVAWMQKSAPRPQVAAHPAVPPLRAAVVQPVPVVEQAVAAGPHRKARRPRVAPAPQAARQEIATDFIPLEETLSLAPIESAQVVRVQMPRSALVRFGFPVNPDRMMDPVNADVVFAQDGIARAIRFVK